MYPDYRHAAPADLPALRRLWQEAFQDSEEFLNRFYSTGFSPGCSLLATDSSRILGAAYWFGGTCRGQKIAYLYGVATGRAFRGQGVASGLLDALHRLLAAQGVRGVLLVPGSAGLFAFYARLGYRPCSPVSSLLAAPQGPAIALHPVSAPLYGALRARMLPPGSVIPDETSLRFQSRLARLYAGRKLLLCCYRENGILQARELLCPDPVRAAPGILKALHLPAGSFRFPAQDGRNFAMFHPLPGFHGPDPAYLGLAFD